MKLGINTVQFINEYSTHEKAYLPDITSDPDL
jgi:hypothetical protein